VEVGAGGVPPRRTRGSEVAPRKMLGFPILLATTAMRGLVDSYQLWLDIRILVIERGKAPICSILQVLMHNEGLSRPQPVHGAGSAPRVGWPVLPGGGLAAFVALPAEGELERRRRRRRAFNQRS